MRVLRNPPLDEELVDRLVQLWVAVSQAGGAVGFTPAATAGEIRPAAEAAFARVRAGDDDLAVADASDAGAAPAWPQSVVGFGLLVTNELRAHQHWGTIRRLQRHPEARGRGIGGLLLDELEAAAVARGLERLVLTVRGGTGREGFYLDRGYALEARLPGRIRVAAGDDREELVMSKVLGGEAGSGAGPGGATTTLRVQRLDQELPVPGYAHPGDAGLDLYARVEAKLEPGERAAVPTGVAVAVPPGCVGLVHPRSGLAARHGVGLVNAPGTVDAGYRGEIQVLLINHDPREPVTVGRGERIAQLIVQRVESAEVVEVAELPDSARGAGGFGSTGR